MLPIVLASTSPYRRELLDRLGIPYEARAHRADEGPSMASAASPVRIATQLARAKAESLRPEVDPDALIIGSDQVVDVDGVVLGKPGEPPEARNQLRRLAGRSHRLCTALALSFGDGRREECCVVTTLQMRALDEGAIARYVAREQPLDCCGAYKIEGAGIALFERIEGDDFTAIMGMPLMRLGAMLRRAGFQVP